MWCFIVVLFVWALSGCSFSVQCSVMMDGSLLWLLGECFAHASVVVVLVVVVVVEIATYLIGMSWWGCHVV